MSARDNQKLEERNIPGMNRHERFTEVQHAEPGRRQLSQCADYSSDTLRPGIRGDCHSGFRSDLYSSGIFKSVAGMADGAGDLCGRCHH